MTPTLKSIWYSGLKTFGIITLVAISISMFFRGRFMPHEHCYLQNRFLIASDLLTNFQYWFAYMVISSALLLFYVPIYKEIKPKTRKAFNLGAAFIFLCGMTHFANMVTLFTGNYYPAMIIYWAGAFVSMYTAFYIMPSFANLGYYIDQLRRMVVEEKVN